MSLLFWNDFNLHHHLLLKSMVAKNTKSKISWILEFDEGNWSTLYNGKVIQLVSVLEDQLQISAMHQRTSKYFTINIQCNIVQIINSILKRSNSSNDLRARKGGEVTDIIRASLSWKLLEGFGSLGKYLETSGSF